MTNTREQFIERAMIVHGPKYDYSNFIYKHTDLPAKIICKIHGQFEQPPSLHLKGSGCSTCAKNKKITKEEFIAEANVLYNHKYNYDKFDFKNMMTAGIIICQKHGEFKKTPFNHVKKKSYCKGCMYDEKVETFIIEANLKHNNKYDYSLFVHPNNNRTPAIIICPIHGEFKQNTYNHLNHGCSACSGFRKKTQEEFIMLAKEKHGDKYDYSKFIYTGMNDYGIIICPVHGEITQRASGHLVYGCKKCSKSGPKTQTTKEFVEKAIKKYGDKFDYSLFKYLGYDELSVFICRKHGEFEQTPGRHLLNNGGCPHCVFKNQGIVFDILKERNINFKSQYRLVINNSLIICDFYLPKFNLIIEYNGEQHYGPVRFSTSTSIEEAEENFIKQQARDSALRQYCIDNKINLLEIDGRKYTFDVLKKYLRDLDFNSTRNNNG